MKGNFFKMLILIILLSISIPAVAAASPATASTTQSYVIISNSNRLPSGLEAAVAAAGGTLTSRIPRVGVAVATSSNPDFAAEVAAFRGVRSVVPNITFELIEPVEPVGISINSVGNPPNSGDDDFFFDLQWGHDAVNAPEAWDRGSRGAGVRVAVLDSGIDAEHPDITPNLNTALSTSFVPGEDFNVRPGAYFNHGTHVAGTVAAADNAFGTIGVAPEAEIVAVKVLSEFTGTGSFEGVMAGIMYAADIQADIINMSLGATIFLDELTDEERLEVLELYHAMSRATQYAYNRGVTVIASAGNSALNTDTDNVLILPAQAGHVIGVSALGPLGWGLDPTTNLDVQAFYTNIGMNLVDFSAPGGNVDFELFDNPSIMCTVAGLTRPCWVFDLVFSTSSESWFWAAGTSMAAPHTSGVAALIIGDAGGSLHPKFVAGALAAKADDLGAPGKDSVHGFGRVSAIR